MNVISAEQHVRLSGVCVRTASVAATVRETRLADVNDRLAVLAEVVADLSGVVAELVEAAARG